MGTDLNREIAGNLGLDTEGFEEVTANDFFVAAKCDDEDCFKKAVEKVDELLNKKAEKSKAEYFPPTLDGAVKVEKSEYGSDLCSGTFCSRCGKGLSGS